jgi:hypothetical protein
MRIEMLACRDRRELGDVLDQGKGSRRLPAKGKTGRRSINTEFK